MTFLELAKKRFSVRKYKDTPIEEEKLMKVLEAARVAPTAANFQPFYIVVVRDEALKERVASTTKYKGWVMGAPAILVICGDHSRSWKRVDGKDHCDIDAAIIIDHMTLQAAELGLGTCWICMFDAKECHEVLNLPEHLETIALIPLGYPDCQGDENRHDTKRKSLDELICWDGFTK